MTRADLEAQVVDLLHDLSRRMRERVHARLVEFDLTPPMAIALHHLAEPMAMGTLADRLSCDASYVTGLADRLEERGLVERRPDVGDRRIRQLVLTAKGRELRRRIHERLYANTPLLDSLDDDELAAFASALKKMLAAASPSASR